MIPHNLKIPKSEMLNVLKKGVIFGNDLIPIKVLFVSGLEKTLFTAVVSKKIAKLAVERHYNQRIIYEIIRKKVSVIKKGYEIVVFPRKSLKDVEFKVLEVKVLDLIKKAGLVD